jgi:hypothetical protein
LDSIDFRLAVSELEQARPDLVGLRVRDVPSLGDWRAKFRLGWSRVSVLNFFGAVLNAAVMFSPLLAWPWVNVVGCVVSTVGFVFCESRYRATTRQLNRLASEQIVRDLMKLRD